VSARTSGVMRCKTQTAIKNRTITARPWKNSVARSVSSLKRLGVREQAFRKFQRPLQTARERTFEAIWRACRQFLKRCPEHARAPKLHPTRGALATIRRDAL